MTSSLIRNMGYFGSAVMLTITSCSPPNKAPFTVSDSVGIAIVDNHAGLWTPEVSWRLASQPSQLLGLLDGDSSQQFSSIVGTVRLPSGLVVVADGGSQELRAFDETSRLAWRAGRRGGGPGEFGLLAYMDLWGGDTLVAYDWRARRFTYFDTSGQFLSEWNIQELNLTGSHQIVGRLDDGRIVVAEQVNLVTFGSYPVGSVARDTMIVRTIVPETKETDVVFRVPAAWYSVQEVENPPGTFRPAPAVLHHSTYPLIAVVGSNVLTGTGDRYELEIRPAQPLGMPLQIVRRDLEPIPITSADVELVMDHYRAQYPNTPRAVRWLEKAPASEFLPAFGGRLAPTGVDLNGNIWIPHYAVWMAMPAGKVTAPGWDVYRSDGVFLGAVASPVGFRPFEFGDNYLLGISRDENDVERVALYDLIKP